MHNIWTLFKSDLRHLFANVVSIIITIGLVVMPSIFAWYNLIACWDVFENTGHLTVAVANEDEGTKATSSRYASTSATCSSRRFAATTRSAGAS